MKLSIRHLKVVKAIKLMFVAFTASIFFTSTAAAENHRIGVIVYDNVLTSDVTGPLEVFGAASRKAWFSDYSVETISAEDRKTITTEEGLTLVADHTLDSAGEFDIIIATSSYEMSRMLKNEKLINFISRHADTADWLSSNCSGAQILAEAGVLDGYKATTWAGGDKSFQSKYKSVEVIEDANVVIDRNRLTSNGSLVSYEAALALLVQIKSEKFANEVSEYLQIRRFMNMDISDYNTAK